MGSGQIKSNARQIIRKRVILIGGRLYFPHFQEKLGEQRGVIGCPGNLSPSARLAQEIFVHTAAPPMILSERKKYLLQKLLRYPIGWAVSDRFLDPARAQSEYRTRYRRHPSPGYGNYPAPVN